MNGRGRKSLIEVERERKRRKEKERGRKSLKELDRG